MKEKPVSYLQTDPRWKDIPYANPGEKATIGGSGCGPSCMAMVVATLTNQKITPIDTCAWSQKNGFKATNQGTYYSYFAAAGRYYGVSASQLNGGNIYRSVSQAAKNYHDTVVKFIEAGNLVIACMGPGNWTSSGHFILLYDIVEEHVYINDPNSTKPARLQAPLSTFQSQVKYYFTVEVKQTPKAHSDNYEAVREKYGFEEPTMQYLEAYKYADSLFAIMLQEDKNLQKYQLNTINYILDYKYGADIFRKLKE